MLTVLGCSALLAWLHLVLLHGGFWRARERLASGTPRTAPGVVAIVPARNEAAGIGAAVTSLLGQRRAGLLHVVVVDDESLDGTAAIARRAAEAAGAADRLTVERTPPRPEGWVGKMWAVHQGVRVADAVVPDAEFVWLTDADIEHAPDNLDRLVARAEDGDLDLVSLMVRLESGVGMERLLIPAFVYFFQMLYPFAHVADRRRRCAAAAGGCMLVRRDALRAAGGIEALRGEIIDDCALARALKARGAIWLGLGNSARSTRGYGGIAGVWSMVARTAFTQLRCSWLLLAGTVVGLALVFLAPPALAVTFPLHGDAVAAVAGAVAWLLMAVSFGPMLAFYGKARWWGLALPLAAALYAAMTADSARRHLAGRGGEWKGRAMAGQA